MSDVWLNYQYTIEFTYANEARSNSVCSVVSVNSNAVKHGSGSYIVNTKNGGSVKRYVYGGSFTEPINVSILLGEGARPWLKWFSNLQTGKKTETRNVTLSLYAYGSDRNTSEGKLWLKWDLINCFPVSWQIRQFGIEDGAQPMMIDMSLQFENMIISDGTDEIDAVMG